MGAPSFLTFEELRTELARFRYREGWELSVFLHPYDGPVFVVQAEVPNSYRPDETTTLRIKSLIPPMVDGDAFGTWLSWRLGRVEIHESREWLQRDGTAFSDPHIDYEP